MQSLLIIEWKYIHKNGKVFSENETTEIVGINFQSHINHFRLEIVSESDSIRILQLKQLVFNKLVYFSYYLVMCIILYFKEKWTKIITKSYYLNEKEEISTNQNGRYLQALKKKKKMKWVSE